MNSKIKIKKVWLVVIGAIVLIAGYYIIKPFFKSPTEGLIIEKIQKSEVLQEVSETGSVRAAEEINLGFKSIGKIARVNVIVGNNVKKGDILAELDVSQTSAQLQSAQAALDAANTQYDKLINGLTTEDRKVYEDAVTSAKTNLNNTYDGSLNTLNNAYTAIYNAYTTVSTLQKDYFLTADPEGIQVSAAKDDIEKNLQTDKKYIDNASNGSLSPNSIDLAASTVAASLNNVYNDLKIIRNQCDSGTYYSQISATDKTALDTQKTYISTALTSINSLQSNIASYRAALKAAEDNLASKTANVRPEDINISQSQIKQAQANINSLQSQVNDNYLISPIDGKITDVNIKRGQVVSPSQPSINMLSTEPFQIKVNIYEQDIVNVKVGNDVKIGLVAFPKQTFEGKVLLIDPAETIVDNVIYYQVTIEFINQPDDIRSGMTADITIETNKKENTLRVPKIAVENIADKSIVQVVNNNKIESREIKTGLEGNDYYEIISGLNEGDQVVVGKK